MQVHVIAIQKHPQSWQAGLTALASAQTHGYEARMFEAYTGHDGRAYLAAQGLALRAGMKPHSLGTAGCFASHHALWTRCAEQGEAMVIAEHDALFVRAWPEPVWQDVLHLNWEGSSLRRARGFADIYAPRKDHAVYRHGFTPYDWPGLVTMSCAYAYALTPVAAARLLDDARQHGWWDADRLTREPVVSIETIHPAVAVEQAIALTLSLTKGRGAD